jgi:hypothetical protein
LVVNLVCWVPSGVHDVDLWVAVALAYECDLRAVGRPRWREVSADTRQRDRVAAGVAYAEDLFVSVAVTIEGDISVGARESGAPGVRRKQGDHGGGEGAEDEQSGNGNGGCDKGNWSSCHWPGLLLWHLIRPPACRYPDTAPIG